MRVLTTSKKSPITGIYPILDAQWLNAKESFTAKKIKSTAKAIAAANISVLQLRCKAGGLEAYEFIDSWLPTLREHCKNTAIIINDRVDLALYFKADGVHMGQDDLPIHLCRQLLGANRIIGLSTHSQIEIHNAAKTTADYIGFGPVFSTTSKTDTQAVQGVQALAIAQKATSLPIVAIGGIGIQQLEEVRETKTAAAAMISGVWNKQGEPQFKAAASCWNKL
ncbi:MAG: thiamine phosphate synthase [Magnetococcales bacterium]|nr:thiamine phosphate synthase [Magnetococcales bacterium]